MEEGSQPLEAHLREHPEDQGAWRVYGDWLLQQGDPRGEAVLLADRLLAMEEGTERDALQRQYEALCTLEGVEHGNSLTVQEWDHGFVRKVSIQDHFVAVKALAALCSHPMGRFLTEAELGGFGAGGLYPDEVGAFGKYDFGKSLRKVMLNCSFGGNALGRALRAMPSLESLGAEVSGYESYLCDYGLAELSSIEMPRLRHLYCRGTPISPMVLPLLHEAKLPVLESVSFSLMRGHLGPLRTASWFAGLTHLTALLYESAEENSSTECHDEKLKRAIRQRVRALSLRSSIELDLAELAMGPPLALREVVLKARPPRAWLPSEALLRTLETSSSLRQLQRLVIEGPPEEALQRMRSRLIGSPALPALQTIEGRPAAGESD